MSDGIPVAEPDHISWEEITKVEWEKIKGKENNDSEIIHFFKSIVDYVATLDDSKRANECLLILESFLDEFNNPNLTSIGVIGLEWIGMKAYNEGTMMTAEIAFRILSECGSTAGKNNYAYMIRRREVSNPDRYSPLTVIQLLKCGVQEREAYSLVNMALTFSLCLGTDEDWHIADKLMAVLSIDDIMGVLSWWSDVAKRGDLEGYLVHFFLLRHHDMLSSDLGTVDIIREKLANGITSFPKWLITEA